MATILIIDNNTYRNRFLSKQLANEGYRILIIDDVEMLPYNLNDSQVDLALLSLQLAGFSTWEILLDIKAKDPTFPVLVYTLKSHDAIIALKETITMVLSETSSNS